MRDQDVDKFIKVFTKKLQIKSSNFSPIHTKYSQSFERKCFQGKQKTTPKVAMLELQNLKTETTNRKKNLYEFYTEEMERKNKIKKIFNLKRIYFGEKEDEDRKLTDFVERQFVLTEIKREPKAKRSLRVLNTLPQQQILQTIVQIKKLNRSMLCKSKQPNNKPSLRIQNQRKVHQILENTAVHKTLENTAVHKTLENTAVHKTLGNTAVHKSLENTAVQEILNVMKSLNVMPSTKNANHGDDSNGKNSQWNGKNSEWNGKNSQPAKVTRNKKYIMRKIQTNHVNKNMLQISGEEDLCFKGNMLRSTTIREQIGNRSYEQERNQKIEGWDTHNDFQQI